MATTVQESNKELVSEYHEALENREYDRLAGFFDPDMTVELMRTDEGESETAHVDELVEKAREFLDAFPDATIEEKEMAAEGDWVLCRTMTEGTHEGEFLGIEPADEEVVMQRHESYRVEDGAFVETHGTVSVGWTVAQLGIDLPFEF